jgi:hypothetical protein
MKRASLLVLAMSLFAVSQSQIRFGARGGLNISNIVGKATEGWKPKAGIFIGGLVEIPVLSKFSVQPELYYSMEGGKWDDEDGGKTSLGYLKMPVLAKYTIASGFYGETGPQIGFLLNATDTWDGDKENIMEYLKKTEFSWVVGAGYYVTPQIGVHARYNAGLSSFYESEKNSVFQVGVQYIFGQTKK